MPSQLFNVIGNNLIWTWPAGVTSVICECLGGSGGGGIANGNPSTGGGGRGGDYAIGTITKGAETTLTVVVPPGGQTAVAGQSAAVQQGGVNKVLGAGGNQGGNGAASANGTAGTGTNGVSIGTTINAGGNGGVGNFTSGVGGSGAGGGAGGPTGAGGAASGNTAGVANAGAWLDGVARSGNGAAGVGNSTVGLNGVDFGGGGSGGKANSGAAKNGGTGSQGVVLLTWTTQPLQRVQATGKVRIGAAAIAWTMPAAPVLGNGLVVLVTGFRSAGMTFGANMSDNWSNQWINITERRNSTNGSYASGVFYCPRITATGTPFTITLAGQSGDFFVGVAIEVGGLAGGSLRVAASTNNTASGTAVTSGTTASISGEVFVATCCVKYQTATSIVAAVVSPVWTEESEELDGTNWVTGECDSRIVTLAGPTSAAWTIAPTGSWSAVIAALQIQPSTRQPMGTIA